MAVQVQAAGLPELDMFRLEDGKKVPHKLKPETRYVAFYLSASWCPPCRKSTPPLIEEYQRMLDTERMPVEIVLVGADHSEKEMVGYMRHYNMKWPALEWRSRAAADPYQSNGIPHLVIVETETGEVVSKGTGPGGVEEVVGKMRELTGVKDGEPFKINGFVDRYGLLLAVVLSCAAIFFTKNGASAGKPKTSDRRGRRVAGDAAGRMHFRPAADSAFPCGIEESLDKKPRLAQ